MTRIRTMTSKITTSLALVARQMPVLGPIPQVECASDSESSLPALRANRNRWSRSDLTSAVGQDPHVTDPAIQVWPPRNES